MGMVPPELRTALLGPRWLSEFYSLFLAKARPERVFKVALKIDGLKPSVTFCGPALHLAISLSSVSTVLLTLLIRRYRVLGLLKTLRDGPVDRASLEKGRTAH